jgi:hypothetical protein
MRRYQQSLEGNLRASGGQKVHFALLSLRLKFPFPSF